MREESQLPAKKYDCLIRLIASAQTWPGNEIAADIRYGIIQRETKANVDKAMEETKSIDKAHP